MGNRGDSKMFLIMNTRYLLLSFFLLFFSKPAKSQDQPCSSGDLHALEGFSGGLDSGVQGWTFVSSAIDCCTWPGVLCDPPTGSHRRVVELDLQNKSLKGFLSESLARLDQLRRLNLADNSLRGPVPLQLFRHPHLERLDLSGNVLSGSIPPDVYLPSIRVFNISYNMFNGSHPILSGSTNLAEFDISFNVFVGRIDTGICNSSTQLRILRFSMNSFTGDFPVGFGNCNSLDELSLDMNNISGNLPEDLFKLSSLKGLYVHENWLSGRMSTRFSNLSNLAQLDLSFNLFTGNIPNVFSRLNMLEYFCAQSNRFHGSIPASLANLPSLKVLNLRNNSLSGHITLNCSAMTRLSLIDLASNSLSGPIPDSMSQCVQLKTLNLAKNSLTGEIPISFRNLGSLSHLSLSNNSLSNVSLALEILQDCPSLNSLVLTMNFFDGERRIPMDGIHGFQNIEVFVIANCDLLGSIPLWLLNCKKLKVLDLSWNRLDGTIPSWIGYYDHLFYLDLSNNSFTGEIPISLTQMQGLISPNNSQQEPPMEDFPFFIKKNTSGKGLQYNQVSSFPPSLILSNNKLVGPILPGFGGLKQLHVLDLSKNTLSGPIPDELSGMSSLETLDLSHNNLTGCIPFSLTSLSFLSSFSVAYNNLVGSIPTEGQFLTFSSSAFEGNPGLCGSHLPPCYSEAQIRTVSQGRKNKGVVIGMAIGIGLGTAFLLLLAIIYLFVSRTRSRRQEDTVKVVADSNGNWELAASTLVLLFQNKDNKELSISDILKSTNNFDQANIIGCGGFGLVYKATLPDGSSVAIKRLSGDYCQMEKEFQAEVQALSRAQHRNLVLLQGYCRIGSDRLLIYSYMENGSLDYWLHEKPDGGSMLDWQKRLRIAQGAARGLAYLHQSCQPHILHRDIKSSNILLDGYFEAHLADFGLARLILPCDTHVTTDLVGTLGYIPPEYGQSSVATFKGDVYSFGVVLLELLTGKRPVDMCKPKGGRDLISWVLQMRKDKRENEVFDPFIYDKEHDSQMRQMLEIACLCLKDSPKLRPLSHQLVAWLDSFGADGHLVK